MERAENTEKTMQPQWMSNKKNYELLMVIVASVLGFGVVITLITLAELANMARH